MAQRFAGIVRPDAAELRRAESHETTSPHVATRPRVGEERAGAQRDQPRIDGHLGRIAEPAPGVDEAEGVLGVGPERREVVDPPSRRLRRARRGALLERSQTGELDGLAVRAQIAGGVGQSDLEPGHLGAIGHAERDDEVVAGPGLVRPRCAGRGEPPAGGQHQEPRNEQHGQEADRQQVELPGADHARGQIGGGCHRQKGKTPAGGTSDRYAPGTGTPSSSLAITASSVCPCTLASDERMIR